MRWEGLSRHLSGLAPGISIWTSLRQPGVSLALMQAMLPALHLSAR